MDKMFKNSYSFNFGIVSVFIFGFAGFSVAIAFYIFLNFIKNILLKIKS